MTHIESAVPSCYIAAVPYSTVMFHQLCVEKISDVSVRWRRFALNAVALAFNGFT